MTRLREILSRLANPLYKESKANDHIAVPRCAFNTALSEIMDIAGIPPDGPDAPARAMEELGKAILLSNYHEDDSTAHSLTAQSCREIAETIRNMPGYSNEFYIPRKSVQDFAIRFTINVLGNHESPNRKSVPMTDDLQNEITRRLIDLSRGAVLQENMTKVNVPPVDLLYKNRLILMAAEERIPRFLFPHLPQVPPTSAYPEQTLENSG